MRPETYDELVEFRARAYAEAWRDDIAKYLGMSLPEWSEWDKMSSPQKCAMRRVARATLEAERAVGIVPVAPVSGAFGPQVEAAKSVARGVDKTTLIVAINAAIAATSYQGGGK